jgi:hypothetical protein
VDRAPGGARHIYTGENVREVANINPYLTEHQVTVVPASKKPKWTKVPMEYGVYYSKSAGLMLDGDEKAMMLDDGVPETMIRQFIGSTEFINGKLRYCLWIDDAEVEKAERFPAVKTRIQEVRTDRLETTDAAVNKLAARPHQFRERKGDDARKIFVFFRSYRPRTASFFRQVLPTLLLSLLTKPSISRMGRFGLLPLSHRGCT